MIHPFTPQQNNRPPLPQPPFESRAPAPFIIELMQKEMQKDGHFTPAAQLVLTPALRTSGLLAAVPAEELKNLLFVLTFLSPGGHILPSIPELATAMHVSEAKARQRMQRLAGAQWQGQPLVTEVKRESGLDAYALAHNLYVVRQHQQQMPPEQQSPLAAVAPATAAGREAVYQFSRSTYATPREEAERLVAEQLGHAEETGDSPEAVARRRLRALGLKTEQLDMLLSRYPLEEITRQLDWMPYRHAKSPARFIVAAIEGAYEPPLALLRLQQQEQHGHGKAVSEQREPAGQLPTGEEGERPSASDAPTIAAVTDQNHERSE